MQFVFVLQDGREKKSVGARRVGGGFTTVVKKRLDVGAVPGTRGASRDSHLRVELLDAEILERGRPGAGGGLGDRARGLGACAKIQTVRCDVEKDVALGCSTAARDPGAARRPRRRARKRRAWIALGSTTTRLNVEPTSRRGPWIVLGPHRQSGRRAPSEGKSLCYVGRKEDAPFFAAQTTWARRAGATRAGAAARTAAPATRAREESTTGAEVIADIVLRSMGPMGRRLRREEKT